MVIIIMMAAAFASGATRFVALLPYGTILALVGISVGGEFL